MATFKCNDPIYTILRNGKVITMSARPATAVSAIIDDASRNVCPPDCCITGLNIDIDSFDVLITSPNSDGMYVRVTVTSGGNDYSTSWVAAAATNTIDITGLIVEFGDWENGNTICVEYSYDQDTVIPACCATVVIPTSPVFNEDATYQLSEVVTECAGGVFDLAFQNPDGGVTVDPTGEMVIPELAEYETVFVTYSCDDCVSELLILTAKNVVPLQGLRLKFNSIGNTPVADPSSVSDWNALFDLPTNGTPFSSLAVAGNEVSLYGGAGITLKPYLFTNITSLIKVEDDALCIVSAMDMAFFGCINCTVFTLDALATISGGNAFNSTGATSLTLPALLSSGAYNSFRLNTSLTSFSAPLTTSLDSQGLDGCTSLTLINIPLCTSLGIDPTDASVFNGITGNTITLNIAAVNATNNGGGPHASVAYLIANNTATINYI